MSELAALIPVARAAFELAAAELSSLRDTDAGLMAEAADLARVPASATGEDLAVSARYIAWQKERLRHVQTQRAALAVEIDIARASTARAFGRWQVLEELGLGARPRR